MCCIQLAYHLSYHPLAMRYKLIYSHAIATHRITHSSSFIQSESNYPLIHHSIPFYEQQTHFLHHLLPSCNLDLTMACLYLRRLLQVTTFLLPTLLLILPIPLQSDHQMLYNLPLIIQVVEIHYFLLKVSSVVIKHIGSPTKHKCLRLTSQI